MKELNDCHRTIIFTAEYSRDRINFLDVQVIREGNELVTDLYVKPTDTHQYLHATSCHVSHSKWSIPYSQTLRLNRICSKVEFFDRRCNDLEKWLELRGYGNKRVRKQVLKARKFGRDELLDRERKNKEAPKVILNLTYHPALSSFKRTLEKLHILLTPDKEHQKVFPDIPVIGFKRSKSLKDHLVRAKLPKLEVETSEGCKGCGHKRCQVCNSLKTGTSFCSREGKSYSIRTQNILNCNSKFVVYLAQCKKCSMQYVGSTVTPFRTRFNNYGSAHTRFLANKKVYQQSFHQHFAQDDHNGPDDWEFILIDQGVNKASVRKKESFWQFKLNTFLPYGLNERTVDTDFD